MGNTKNGWFIKLIDKLIWLVYKTNTSYKLLLSTVYIKDDLGVRSFQETIKGIGTWGQQCVNLSVQNRTIFDPDCSDANVT